MIKVTLFYDALGSPKDFVKSYLQDILQKIKDYEGINIKDISILDPIEQENGLYSALAIVKAEFEDLQSLVQFILDFTPSTIEIESPEGPEEVINELEKDIKELENSSKAIEKIKKIKKELKLLKSLVPTKSFLNMFLNDLITKQHQMGMLIKNLQAENILLKQRLSQVSGKEDQNKSLFLSTTNLLPQGEQ